MEAKMRESLKLFGFTEYHIAVYTMLLTHGESPARTISLTADVPYTRIYEILNELIDKGFIEKDEAAKPMIYRAVEPTDALGRIKSEREKGFDKAVIRTVETMEGETAKGNFIKKSTISWLENGEHVVEKIKSMVATATVSIDMMMPVRKMDDSSMITELCAIADRTSLPSRIKLVLDLSERQIKADMGLVLLKRILCEKMEVYSDLSLDKFIIVTDDSRTLIAFDEDFSTSSKKFSPDLALYSGENEIRLALAVKLVVDYMTAGAEKVDF